MRPQWLARLVCRWLGHPLVLLTDDDERLDVGEECDTPVVCDRCFTFGTATIVRVEA